MNDEIVTCLELGKLMIELLRSVMKDKSKTWVDEDWNKARSAEERILRSGSANSRVVGGGAVSSGNEEAGAIAGRLRDLGMTRAMLSCPLAGDPFISRIATTHHNARALRNVLERSNDHALRHHVRKRGTGIC